ncbi:thermonuclease family protein [Haloferax larsenii]|uniref:Thermonuclease family protein n=1 Tax=Haloferax larsenii TaxID=302484 RepID=A0ABY5RB43_HALLR|nr:DUF4350 domain-containing protein [Haloferax larsenii]UVE49576.1 thermonuclease family protein [Haloferax larsenii]
MQFNRRTFLQSVVTATVAGSSALEFGTTSASAAAGPGCESTDRIPKIEFHSASSQVTPNHEALADPSVVAVWAEPTATNGDDDGNGDAYHYDELAPLPLVSVDGSVYGFGAILLQDDDINFDYGNEEFVLNAWDAELGGSGTVLWDEGHGQYFTLDSCSKFESYAENNGYTVSPTTSLASDLSNADAVVVTTPSESFSSSELGALAEFVADGGALYLHDQSDYSDYDETANLNEIASELDLAFRFNDDDIDDDTNNVDGASFDITTSQYNTNTFALFEDRSGLGLDAGVRYEATVDSVADGDTVDVTLADGTTAELRLLGIDTPETERNASHEKVEEWEGIEDETHLTDWGENAKEYAKQALGGASVEIEFDPSEDITDPFGRHLAYVYYDTTGDGNADTLFNREMVETGYARVYGSSLTKHDAFWNAEADARAAGTGVWQASDPANTAEVRDRPVEDVFVPNAASVRTTAGAISSSRVPVFAESTATQDLRDGVQYSGDIPLVGVDAANRTALVGGLPIDESYRADVTAYEHEAFLTNLVDSLSDRCGKILVDGGHGQFNESHSVSTEDAVAYQRYLEGQDIAFEQVNSLDGSGDNALSTARAVLISAPRSCFAADEIDALRTFVQNGGAVILMGSGDGKIMPDTRANLNDVAGALGTDLRLNGDHVFDSDHNVGGDPALLYTGTLNTAAFSLWSPYS